MLFIDLQDIFVQSDMFRAKLGQNSSCRGTGGDEYDLLRLKHSGRA